MTNPVRVALANRRPVQPLLTGEGAPCMELVEFVLVPKITSAFRAMVNDSAFDVCEMPLTTLAMAIEHGRPLIGLPVVLNRDFHHRSIVINTRSGIRSPADLIGRRIGVRAYSQTTGVWVRGLLQDEYGVDPASIDWVTYEGSHVTEYADPAHVSRAPRGATITEMLSTGELDAAAIIDPKIEHTDVAPLFPNADSLARDLHLRNNIFPVNHVLAINSELAATTPGLTRDLYDAFVASKERYLGTLRTIADPTAEDRRNLANSDIVGRDPLPYGLSQNARSMQLLIRYALEQGLLKTELGVDELFDPQLHHT